MWMGCIKLSLLGREHLSKALVVLTNSLKLFQISKRDFWPLNCLPVEQEICRMGSHSHLKRVETHLPCSFAKGNRKQDFYTYIYPRFSQAVAWEINKLWASSFFWKYSKLNLDFENKVKNREKVFSFWDNCMWMGCIKLSLLWRERLSTALVLLTNSLKLFHISKRDFLPLNCLPVEQ